MKKTPIRRRSKKIILVEDYAGFWLRFCAFLIDWALLGFGFFLIPFHFFTIVMTWLYYALLESSPWQATIGKKLLEIKVTDMNGARISFRRATVRYFSKILSTFIFCIGFFMIAFTKRKQGLHDIIADTLVVNKK